jgi:uncharacterized protein (TIGR03067 family)
MTVRLTFAFAVLLGLTAFAPAPLPRADRRGRSEITLDTFQGNWRVTNMETSRANGQHTPYQWNVTHILIEKDRWSFVAGNAQVNSLYISVDGSKKPAHLNFYDRQGQKQAISGVGLIRKHGAGVQVLYRWGSEQNRPLTFEGADGPWIITMQK